jgi:cupin 2 domain-containing protein
MLTNLFEKFPVATDQKDQETFEDILNCPDIRIERIISTGQASPPGFWYCQPQSEWVVLLKGSAGLLFEGESEARVLHPGDFVTIPAQCRHRVEWTDPTMPTVWLAVHYKDELTGTQ